MNIRVDLQKPIYDGMNVVFRSPVDCSQITGLIVYYMGEDGNTGSKEFVFADAHGNNVGDIDHLFAENVVVKVILDVTSGMAFVQNADTNAYLEGRFAQLNAAVESVGDGESAYEIAIANGFEGTETEWLESLKGDPGSVDYYSTTREEVGQAHENINADYIFGLYDALMAEHPDKVQKNEVHNDDGTFTNYEYVISTGEYPEGTYNMAYGNSPAVKKPKFLVMSGIHGTERKTVYSTYRFIRDVLSGHNVPQQFRQGVILSVLPIGTPSAFDAFLRQSGNAVDINRNFDYKWEADDRTDENGNAYTHGSAAASEPETQVIQKWLSDNSDAELFIDFHNNGVVHEKVLILSTPDNSISNSARKIALRGVDNVIPYWRDVIGYPDTVESPGYTEDMVREVKERDIIYSYSATVGIGGLAFAYAQEVVGIPSIAIETAVYYGDYTDWEIDKTADSPEAVAMGAEALGNILIEFYENEVKNMADIDSKLDTILEQVTNGFRVESGTIVIEEDITSSNDLTIPCSAYAKAVDFHADEATTTAIKATTGTNFSVSFFGNGFAPTLGGGVQCSVLYAMKVHPTDSTKWLPSVYSVSTFNNTNGFTFRNLALMAGTYNWTAYYWNE